MTPPNGIAAGASGGAILVVYAGGTFGMRDHGRGLEATADIAPNVVELVRAHDARAERPLDWDLVSVSPPIDSAQADAATAPELARLVRRRVVRGVHRGVVLVHGTDTLAHTAARLAFELADLDLVVACTGSQVPYGLPGSDADANFLDAVGAVTGEASRGVWVVFGGRRILAVRATKRSSADPDGFIAHRAPGRSPLGVPAAVTDALAAFPDAASPDAASPDAANPDAANPDAASPDAAHAPIGVLHVTPGLSPAVVEATVRAHPRGFVLACYGAGTAPAFVAPIVRDGIAAGAVVLAITQCEDGPVQLGRYAVGAALADAGVVSGGDLTVEAAIAKLGALLDAGLARDEITTLLGANLLGERSPDRP